MTASGKCLTVEALIAVGVLADVVNRAGCRAARGLKHLLEGVRLRENGDLIGGRCTAERYRYGVASRFVSVVVGAYRIAGANGIDISAVKLQLYLKSRVGYDFAVVKYGRNIRGVELKGFICRQSYGVSASADIGKSPNSAEIDLRLCKIGCREIFQTVT